MVTSQMVHRIMLNITDNRWFLTYKWLIFYMLLLRVDDLQDPSLSPIVEHTVLIDLCNVNIETTFYHRVKIFAYIFHQLVVDRL